MPKPPGGAARNLERLLHQQEHLRHLEVAPWGKHLVIRWHDGQETIPVARLSYEGAGNYRPGLMQHTGRWENLPFLGPLEEMGTTLIEVAGPYLEKW